MVFQKKLEARGGIEPPIKVLQTFALPLGDRALLTEPVYQEPNSSHTIGAFQPKANDCTIIAQGSHKLRCKSLLHRRKINHRNSAIAAKKQVAERVDAACCFLYDYLSKGA